MAVCPGVHFSSYYQRSDSRKAGPLFLRGADDIDVSTLNNIRGPNPLDDRLERLSQDGCLPGGPAAVSTAFAAPPILNGAAGRHRIEMRTCGPKSLHEGTARIGIVRHAIGA